VKAERNSKRLSVLQQASRHVNEMAANVVASTRTGQEHLEDKGEDNLICVDHFGLTIICLITLNHFSCAETMDFSGLSVIKLRKEEMESQVSHGRRTVRRAGSVPSLLLIFTTENINSLFL